MPTPVAGYAQGQGPSRPTTPVPDMRKLYGVAAGSPGLILPQGPAFALGKAQGMAGQGQPEQPIDQSQLVKGHQLDYWSDLNPCWMPATITEADSESGSIYLNVKPNTPFRARTSARRFVHVQYQGKIKWPWCKQSCSRRRSSKLRSRSMSVLLDQATVLFQTSRSQISGVTWIVCLDWLGARFT